MESNPDFYSMPTVAITLVVIPLTVLVVWSQRNSSSSSTIPVVPSWIPILGHGPALFSAPYTFTRKLYEAHGKRAYFINMFGTKTLVLFDTRDIKAALRSPEKSVSMYRPIKHIVGFAFPKEDFKDYPTPEMRDKISAGKYLDNVTSVPGFIHSLNKEKLQSWIPGVLEVLEHNFQSLPNTGEKDLFKWCQDLISSVTVRVLLGDAVLKEPDLLPKFVSLFYEGDPEVGFRGPIKSFKTMAECTIFGERRIFARVRKLLYPYLDAEIESVLNNKDPTKDKEDENDSSVLSSLVRYWYKRLDQDPVALRVARRRMFNDIFLFTFAAFTNSYAGAAWMLYHYIRNTNGVTDSIRPEFEAVERVLKTGKLEDFKVPKTENMVLEITRLYTPGIFMREVMKPWKMPSTEETIPPGTQLLIPLGMAGRNPANFSNPLSFDPSRFEPGRDEHKNGNLLGFGIGSHPCVGKRFALLEMSIFVCQAARHFDMEILRQGKTDDMTEASFHNNVPETHPRLEPGQIGFLWRPVDPIVVRFSRKK